MPEPLIRLGLLGPVQLLIGDEPPARELLWRKNLALLAYLARSPDRQRSRAHLLGLLWGDKPESAARHSLNEALRTLRRFGGEELVISAGERVTLAAGQVELDTDRLEAELAAGAHGEAAARIRGIFMEGFEVADSSTFEDWLAAERIQWRRRSVEALAACTETLLTRGAVVAASDAAEQAARLDPLSNAAARLGMRAAALTGERARSLELYERFRERLAAELAVEPEPETARLADRVRLERSWKLPEAVREEEAPGRRPPLVGREQELERALAVWRRCVEGNRCGLLVLEGEPGIGKTRLAEEVLARARLDGGVLAAIRAVAADQEAPWSGVVGLLRGGMVDAPGLTWAPPAALAAAAVELPEWRERFGDEISTATPAHLGRALGEILLAVTDEQPLVLLVDDAEWLDGESALALAAALRDLEERACLLILTSAAQPPREEFEPLRAHIGRALEGAVIPLRALEAASLAAWAGHVLPDYGPEARKRIARRLMADSAGIPLLASELLNAVRLGLELEETPGEWPLPHKTLDQTLPGELPDAVTAAIRIGFRRLSRGAQRVLAAAAVLGDRVEAKTLAAATGLSPEETEMALDELEWGRWLASEPRGYAFVARIVAEVVKEEMMTPGQRRRILEAVRTQR